MRSAPRPLVFAVVCLAYFLLSALGAHLWATPPVGHRTAEIAHLPPDAASGKASAETHGMWTSLAGNSAMAQIAGAGPSGQYAFDGPDLTAAVATVVAALLASCFELVRRPAFAVFLSVLGVGRWHRSVVLHL
ncbi:MAG: hypothetical protein J0H99_14205 [Rhodospirillales bacterium]|nr:hypothetical protein [Rhodospirillales bacterium]